MSSERLTSTFHDFLFLAFILPSAGYKINVKFSLKYKKCELIDSVADEWQIIIIY